METDISPKYFLTNPEYTEVQLYEKYYVGKLSQNLNHTEFRCKCTNPSCTYTLVNNRVVTAFQIVRKHWGRPIGVSSGFRCQMHNIEVGGVLDSWHKRGFAIDIFPYDGDIEILYEIANSFFDLVIWYKEDNFLHCQMEA